MIYIMLCKTPQFARPCDCREGWRSLLASCQCLGRRRAPLLDHAAVMSGVQKLAHEQLSLGTHAGQRVADAHLGAACGCGAALDIHEPHVRALNQARVAHVSLRRAVVHDDPGGLAVAVDGAKDRAALFPAAEDLRLPGVSPCLLAERREERKYAHDRRI